MADILKTNTANLYLNATTTTPTSTASTDFVLYGGDTLLMTKVANRVGEYYFPGNPITFTITITNVGAIGIGGLVFKDTIDSIIEPETGTDFVITTTSGTVTSATQNIVIEGISIEPLGVVTITITGEIVNA